MSTEEQKEIFEHQMKLAKAQGLKEKVFKPHIKSHTDMRDKITPQIRKKFLKAINQTKETGIEHGFHICIDNNGKLSPGFTHTLI